MSDSGSYAQRFVLLVQKTKEKAVVSNQTGKRFDNNSACDMQCTEKLCSACDMADPDDEQPILYPEFSGFMVSGWSPGETLG